MASRSRGKTAVARRKAAAAKKNLGYKDANKDNVPDVDPLEREQLASEYQSAVGIIYSVPEIKPLFEKAVQEKWSPTKFAAAVQNSDWFKNNNQYARKAWAQENLGGEDWKAALDDARNAVQAAATQIGAEVTPQELESLARRYIYEGWSDSTRSMMMAKALSGEISYLPDERGSARMVGGAGKLEDDLRNLARANGITYADNWYLGAAKSVASGLSTTDTWERDIRETAASMWGPYAEQIRAGQNVYDLASPFINTMAQEFEIDPSTITLGDPYIRSAMTNMDQNGQATPLNLWEFTKKLRNDPRWENTSKAQNEITSITGKVMQTFGLMAG